MALALFDLDETLIAGDCSSLWLNWLIQRGIAPLALREQERALMEEYAKGSMSMSAYIELTLKPLLTHSIISTNVWINEFIEQSIAPVLYPQAREKLSWHQQRGDVVVIISASAENLVRPIAAYLGVKHAIAILLETEGDYYTGKPYGTFSYQQGKVTRVQQWLAQHPDISLSGSYAYSDSINDLPLLELAEHAIAVNPDDRLKPHAQAKGWPCINWSVKI